MTVSTRHAGLVSGVLLAAAVATAAPLNGQQPVVRRVAPPEGAPRFMVPMLKAPDTKVLGSQVADAIRTRLSQDFQPKDLWVIPKENIEATLKASGFPPDEPPDRVTTRLLAQNLRADEYLEGTVTRAQGGLRAETNMVLTRDNTMTQPLPAATGGRPADLAAQISRSLRDARKQLADERKCEQQISAGNNDQAIQFARAAIAAYPNSTIGRVCMAQAMVNKKLPVDSVIAVTQQVLQIDPRNRPALALAAQAYTDANRDSLAVDAWTRLLALDPNNVKLQTQVVNVLAASGNARPALPIIDTAVAQNPGDPELLRLQFLVHLTVAAKDPSAPPGWKGVIAPGEALLKSDTTVDTLFFRRLATAYAADSQPQKAAETVAQGVKKFPNNASLWAFYAAMLRAAGQNQQALGAVSRAFTLDPKNTTALLTKADIQADLGQVDSAIATLKQAQSLAADGDKSAIGQRLLILGNKSFKAAQASQKREDWEKAVAVLAQADSIASSPQSNFLLGVAAFQAGDKAVRENQSAKKCDLAQEADQMFTLVQLHLPKGAQVQQQTAGQLMQAVGQYTPAVEQQKKKFCKNR